VDTWRIAAEFLEYSETLGHADATRRAYRWGLKRLAASCPRLPADAKEVQRVINARDLAIESRKDLYRLVKHVLAWAEREHGMASPMQRVQAPKSRKRRLPRVFNPDEIQRIYSAIDSQRDLALVSLPLDTGLRVGEISRIERPNVFPHYIRVDYDGKTGERTVPVSPRVRDLLMDVGDGDHLWLGRWGPLTTWGIQQIYIRLFKRAGLTGRKLGPHALRHTFGTWYIERGGSVKVLQEILGHQDLQTTMLYVHLAGSHVRADHAQFSPANELPLDLMGRGRAEARVQGH
jgi:integrase